MDFDRQAGPPPKLVNPNVTVSVEGEALLVKRALGTAGPVQVSMGDLLWLLREAGVDWREPIAIVTPSDEAEAFEQRR